MDIFKLLITVVLITEGNNKDFILATHIIQPISSNFNQFDSSSQQKTAYSLTVPQLHSLTNLNYDKLNPGIGASLKYLQLPQLSTQNKPAEVNTRFLLRSPYVNTHGAVVPPLPLNVQGNLHLDQHSNSMQNLQMYHYNNNGSLSYKVPEQQARSDFTNTNTNYYTKSHHKPVGIGYNNLQVQPKLGSTPLQLTQVQNLTVVDDKNKKHTQTVPYSPNFSGYSSSATSAWTASSELLPPLANTPESIKRTLYSPTTSSSNRQEQISGYRYPTPNAPRKRKHTTTTTPTPETLILEEYFDSDSESEEMASGMESFHVICGKDIMKVRIVFKEEFNGTVYAKGHYQNSRCNYIKKNSRRKVYEFDVKVNHCGIAFVDEGLQSGGKAYVEGMLETIYQPGLQEAWDSTHRIRCYWEGRIEDTVKAPIINLEQSSSQIRNHSFDGDTASVSMQIQHGRGPKAIPVSGLVRIGDQLTAVITVDGDPDFDILVRNCFASDGSSYNKLELTDHYGCPLIPKYMGGWSVIRDNGNKDVGEYLPRQGAIAYAFINAFRFPDIMELVLECQVTLCKGDCPHCQHFVELETQNKHHIHHSMNNHVHSESQSEEELQDIINIADIRTLPHRLSRRSVRRLNRNDTKERDIRIRQVIQVVTPEEISELEALNSEEDIQTYQADTDNDGDALIPMTILVGSAWIILFILWIGLSIVFCCQGFQFRRVKKTISDSW